jgi:arylsulfatase A-like enzyme
LEDPISRRQVLMASGATIAGLALGPEGSRWFTERRTLAGLRGARREAPNILLVVLDTVRAQSLSLHGYARPTSPNLERLAQRGVRFERAMAPSSWTLPSHATMFTGRYMHETEVDWTRPLGRKFPTIAEILTAHGYETAGFVANMFYCGRPFGLARGFAHYEDYRKSPGQIIACSSVGNELACKLKGLLDDHQMLGRKSADHVNASFLRWVDRREGAKRPFFAFLNYMDAHDPYIPPGEYATAFSPLVPQRPLQIKNRRCSAADAAPLRDAYERCITGLDARVGALFERLQGDGLLDNTLVIITSDHGEHFGEFGLSGHGMSLYLPLLHVPLLVSFPGVPADTVVSQAVSLRDLGATILDVAGLKDMVEFPGESLARYWAGERALHNCRTEPIFSEVGRVGKWRWGPASKGSIRCIVADEFQYISNSTGREELYDIRNEQTEEGNLVAIPEHDETLIMLRRHLDSFACGSPPPASKWS